MQSRDLQDLAAALASLAHERLLGILMDKNTVSPGHHRATRQMLDGMAAQAVGTDPGRYAYGLPCGGGKTQGVVALIAASHELGLGLTFAVATSQIEALCGIKRDLIQAGIPAESIGLMHGYKWRSEKDAAEAVGPGTGYASEPTTPLDREYPILLLSHAKIQNGCTATYEGKPRNLLIWDESLLSTNAAAMSVKAIRRAQALAGIDKPELVPYVAKVADVVLAELAYLNENTAHQPRMLPELLTLAEAEEAERIANTLGGRDKDVARLREHVLNMLALIGRPVSVLATGNGDSGDGFLRYNVTVSDALHNVAVLDASHVLRELTQADASIVDRTTPEMIGYKSYANVTVNQIKLATGKQNLTGGAEGSLPAAREVQRVIDTTPPDECVLVFTFKDAVSRLEANLRNLGVNLRDTVEIDGVRRKRIELLTWGQETSRNDLLHCKHVVMAGVLRRNPLELAAALTGQQRAGDTPQRHSAQTLLRLNLSEMAHCVLQGMNRGSCRVMDAHGQAQRMTLTILVAGAEGLHALLKPVLPGIVWSAATPELKRSSRGPSRTTQAAEQITHYLSGLDVAKVSVSAVMKVLKINLSANVRTDAVNHALLLTVLRGERWWREGRSLVRDDLHSEGQFMSKSTVTTRKVKAPCKVVPQARDRIVTGCADCREPQIGRGVSHV